MIIATVNNSLIDMKLEGPSINSWNVKVKITSKNMVLVVRGLDDQVFEC
jgi:hypothetical protein